MSGVEALGLALGILPLIVSAIEHYDDVLRPIRRYRQFTSKAQMFCDELDAERTIFQAECQVLLGTVVEYDVAQEMLSDLSHPAWSDEAVRTRFSHELGKLGVTCLSIISKIEAKLNEISNAFKEFHADTSLAPNEHRTNTKDWLRIRKKKLKFAFSENSLRISIGDLRVLNSTFLTLSGQVIRLDNQPSHNNQNLTRLSYSKKAALKKFRVVQTASCRLYEALSLACTSHQEHLAKISLEATCEDLSLEVGHPRIHFSMAYACAPSIEESPISYNLCPSGANRSVDPRSEDEIWAIGDSKISSAASSEWISSSKWFEVESILSPEQDATAVQQGQLKGKGPAGNRFSADHSGYLRSEDFCDKLQARLGQDTTFVTKSVGIFLENSESCKHSVHYPSVRVPPSLAGRSMSLTQLLSPLNLQLTGTMPQIYRICIAKSLAIAVLQFHTSPWLKDSWRSDNVLLSEVKPEAWESYVPSPHLTVRVAATNQTTEASINHLPSISVGGILPNSVLFSLGIMLLELAYGAPFRSLLQPESYENSTDSRMVDFVASWRLANSVAVYFGAGYADIVRKCLRCDFGQGEDLNNPALQERLYEDVICRLEDIENGVRKARGEI